MPQPAERAHGDERLRAVARLDVSRDEVPRRRDAEADEGERDRDGRRRTAVTGSGVEVVDD